MLKPRAGPWLLGAAACALLLLNVAARARTHVLDAGDQGWRGWDDLAIASGYAERRDFPVAPYVIGNRYRRRSDEFAAFRRLVVDGAAAARLEPMRFWRPLPAGALASVPEWRIARRFDDVGRSVLLMLGFRALGGVAPFLILWLAPLALLPVLVWTAFEFRAAGRLVDGAAFLLALGTSAFVVDALTLGYSAVGFYLLSLLLLVPFAVYTGLGTPTPRGLVLRLLALSLALSVCILSRSASLLTVPGYVMAVAVAVWRMSVSRGRARTSRTLAGAALGAALLLAAFPVFNSILDDVAAGTVQRYGQRRPIRQGHDVWSTVWQGLGDFDRTHGHVYTDRAAEDAVLAAGAREWLTPEGEEIMRRLVWTSIASEPSWYVGILAKRTLATITLRKLWPWPPLGGRSLRPASTANEGVTDNYYGLVSPADTIRIGALKVELPMVLWLFSTALLLALAWAPGRDGGREWLADARPALVPLACLAVGALATPVAITTASAFEAESFIVTHHLAFGFLAGAVFRASTRARARRRPPILTPRPVSSAAGP